MEQSPWIYSLVLESLQKMIYWPAIQKAFCNVTTSLIRPGSAGSKLITLDRFQRLYIIYRISGYEDESKRL